MKQIINKIYTIFLARPSNAFLLFLTGFFFIQFMFANILYIKHPFGGWMTSMGTFTNASILFTLLLALSVCMFTLWLSVVKTKRLDNGKVIKSSIVKSRSSYSPIDFPNGTTTAVVVPTYSLS